MTLITIRNGVRVVELEDADLDLYEDIAGAVEEQLGVLIDLDTWVVSDSGRLRYYVMGEVQS